MMPVDDKPCHVCNGEGGEAGVWTCSECDGSGTSEPAAGYRGPISPHSDGIVMPVDDLASTLESEQRDAALREISRAVVRHYLLLTGAGMSPKRAVRLCESFQDDLMCVASETYVTIGIEDAHD